MEVVIHVATGVNKKGVWWSKNKDGDLKASVKCNINIVQSTSMCTFNDPLDLYFEDIRIGGFFKDQKPILSNVSGKFSAGQLIGIIGPSGSGKTTLLDVLSGFRTSGMSGTICINKIPRDLNNFKKISCYITHENYLQPLLTVWENMMAAANLKLGPSVVTEEKEAIIQEILNTLFLEKAAHTRTSYLSGGQRKRLSIALELICNPKIMFLDEPTTGLDSLSCRQCVTLLQKLARSGRTIVCTINQPPASLFQIFDVVYVLGEGKCIYQGTAENLIPYLNYVEMRCPKYHNPADYVIELACGEYGNDKISILEEAIENGKCEKWLEDPTHFLRLTKLNESQLRASHIASTRYFTESTSSFHQFKILVQRGLLKSKRDETLTYMRLAVNIFIGLLFGTLYWQSGTNGVEVYNNYSLLFCVLIFHMMSTMMLTILTFPTEISVVVKEHFNRWYSLKVYFASATFVDVPVSLFCCLVFTAIVYLMTGQPVELARIVMFTSISILVVLVSQSSGLLIGSIFNVVNGTFIGFSTCIVTMLFAGYAGENVDGPFSKLKWISYLSFMKYAFEGIVGSVYGFDRGALYCPEDLYCHYKYPKKLLKDVEIVGDEFWVDVIGLCVILILLRFMSYYVLRWKLMAAR